ncbi:MAG: hypothetical protein M3N29_10510 [Chloroflexota bacterium]|nr:hypothetical protein [Chloroflexota bacterium]
MDLLRAQGAYYIVSGLWPVVHLPSFYAVTGPKQESWLVQTFGLLTAAVGGGLLAAKGREERIAVERIALGAAAALAVADVSFVARRRVGPVYLLDAALEAAFVAGLMRRSSGRR